MALPIKLMAWMPLEAGVHPDQSNICTRSTLNDQLKQQPRARQMLAPSFAQLGDILITDGLERLQS